MGETTLTNNGDLNVQVKEGNSNIFRILKVLKPRESMTIKTDSNATYREYVLFTLPDNKKLRSLSSDDIQELSAVEIFKNKETGEYDWRELSKESQNKSFLRTVLGWFSSKAGAKADANSDPKAGANVGANADSSKSSTATQ